MARHRQVELLAGFPGAVNWRPKARKMEEIGEWSKLKSQSQCRLSDSRGLDVDLQLNSGQMCDVAEPAGQRKAHS